MHEFLYQILYLQYIGIVPSLHSARVPSLFGHFQGLTMSDSSTCCINLIYCSCNALYIILLIAAILQNNLSQVHKNLDNYNSHCRFLLHGMHGYKELIIGSPYTCNNKIIYLYTLDMYTLPLQ